MEIRKQDWDEDDEEDISLKQNLVEADKIIRNKKLPDQNQGDDESHITRKKSQNAKVRRNPSQKKTDKDKEKDKEKAKQ
eukprot:CAMPEP_0116951830 /NCGR_PEP_ID=MMETSP0467-20121206/40364_1 /TAXON_ID=283647 /ORGANISM="Mesodinium pulex, Strain SPMC105" /LENGTH=78 /DNA_ID=CAMNT_0004636973 /DNA_START=629 /DNA_END=865 /DNA_ORIENTATION=-